MKTTIKDIAKRVGVNPSTVSRVINGTASISDEVKAKIYEAMRELDYHPNSQARSLVSGSTKTIGLVIHTGNKDSFSNAYFIQSISAIENIAQSNGFNLLIINFANLNNREAIKGLVLENRADGVILPISSITDDVVKLLQDHEFPFVVMGEPEENSEGDCFWVDMDNQQGGCLAVDHLMEHGFKHPVLIVEDTEKMFERKRILGFKNGLKKWNIPWNESYIIECGTEGLHIKEKMADILNQTIAADSIICTNNIVAYNVLQELKKGGIKVPEDMGVVTFDNYPLAEYMDPPLTVVDVDTYKMGEQAAVVLFEKIKHVAKKEKNMLIPTQIISRSSTQRS